MVRPATGLVLLLVALLLLPAAPGIRAQANADSGFHPLGEWREVNSPFGYRRSPFGWFREYQFHRGIDLESDIGDPVFAWRSGTVVYTGRNSASGLMIHLDHGDGYVSKYHHLDRILVLDGEAVAGGQEIALAGATGRVTGSHLHFTLMKNGEHLDPYPYLRRSATVLAGARPTRPVITVRKTVTVNSTPNGAAVLLNGETVGETPLTLEIPYGSHFLEISAGEGYQPHRDRLTVDDAFPAIYRIQLRPPPPDLGRGGDLMGDIPDRDALAGTALPSEAAGMLFLETGPMRPTNDRFADLAETPHLTLHGGVSLFLPPVRWAHSLYAGIAVLQGNFRPGVEYYPPADNQTALRVRRLDSYAIVAGALGYAAHFPLGSLATVTAGVEVNQGWMRMRTVERVPNGDGAPGDPRLPLLRDGTPDASRLSFRAPSLVGAVELHLTRAWSIRASVRHTLRADPVGWRGIQIGVGRRFALVEAAE